MTQPEPLPPYRYRDVGALASAVLAQHRLPAGDALLVLVREPSTMQQVEHVSRVRRGRWRSVGPDQRSRVIERIVDAMPIPASTWSDGPRYSVLTIVGRYGFTVPGREEGTWMSAWWYAHPRSHIYSGELVLVTEHGWLDVMGEIGGAEPRLAA